MFKVKSFRLGLVFTLICILISACAQSTKEGSSESVEQIPPKESAPNSLNLLVNLEMYQQDSSPVNLSSLLSELQYDPALKIIPAHTDQVTSIVFSPDGKLLASGSDDLSIILWDTDSWEQVGEPLLGHQEGSSCRYPCEGQITSLAFSPDGKLLASSGVDTTIRFWDPKTRKSIGEPLTGHEELISQVAFSPDGLILASSSWDGTIRLWDPSTGDQIGIPLSGHDYAVNTLAFNPDGSLLASADLGTSIIIWDPKTREQVQTISASALEVAFSPDGKILASTVCGGWNDGLCVASIIELWDPVSGENINQIISGLLFDTQNIAFSPDGAVLISGNILGPIRIWDSNTGEQIGDTIQQVSLENIVSITTDLTLSPNGNMLASAGCSLDPLNFECTQGEILLWDPLGDITLSQRFGTSLIEIPSADISEFYISNDAITVAAWLWTGTSDWDQAIRLFELDHEGDLINKTDLQSEHTDYVTDLAFSPDGSLIATSSGDGTIHLIDTESKTLHCDPLTGHIYITWGVTFNHDGSILASYGAQETILLWDPQTCEQIGDPLIGHTDIIHNIAFNPDGSILASISDDGTIQFWDPSTGEEARDPLSGDFAWNSTLVFAPDGQTLVSNGDFIQLWNLETGELREFDSIYLGEVTAAAISPDGRLLASAICLDEGFYGDCVSMGILIWDVETGEQIGTFLEGSSGIHSLTFSQDGKKLFSSGCKPGEYNAPCEAGEVRSWDIDVNSWIERACQAAARNLTLSEWEEYFPDQNYQETCPEWPSGE